MIRHATRRAAASMVITALLILTLTGCHELNNIVDPDAADYQGYYTVETPSDVGPDSPSDGETLYFQAFFASRVYDRTDLGPYHFTVSTSSDLTYTSGYLLDNDTVATNMFSTSLDLIVGTAYYWGVEVYDPGTTEWTGRGGSLSFIPGSIDISSVSPGDAESVDTNYPLIEWGPIEGATGVPVTDCQFLFRCYHGRGENPCGSVLRSNFGGRLFGR